MADPEVLDGGGRKGANRSSAKRHEDSRCHSRLRGKGVSRGNPFPLGIGPGKWDGVNLRALSRKKCKSHAGKPGGRSHRV